MDGNKADENNQQFLAFQDFSSVNRSGGQALLDLDVPIQPATNNLSHQPTAPQEDFLQAADQSTEKPSPSFWTIEYYQKFFNVTTNDVLDRIKRSVNPFGIDNYLITHIRPNPDLYGPFWICITLIFAVGMSGNIANYFQAEDKERLHWKYDFHMVSVAATCLFLYAWLLPLSIWGALKWTNNNQKSINQDELIQSENTLGLLEIICVYGYSLSIYIPVAFLWIIQISWFQWCLVIFAACLSGSILLRSLSPAITGKHKIIYMAVMLTMHLLLATGVMLYFFYAKSHSSAKVIVSNVTTTAASIVNPPTLTIISSGKNHTSVKTR